MQRREVAIATVSLALVASGAWLWLRGGPPSYASLRQAGAQEIPGTWGLTIEPPPGDFDPSVTPQRAYRTVGGQAVRSRASQSLASVPVSFIRRSKSTEMIPSWVIVTRGLCFASSKGELVSSSRREPADVAPSCTSKNLWVVMVDARTGKGIASLSGYDPSGSWSLALTGA